MHITTQMKFETQTQWWHWPLTITYNLQMCNEAMCLLKLWKVNLKVEWMSLEGDQWSIIWLDPKKDITTCRSRALQIVYS
jgi:hypothetical protein